MFTNGEMQAAEPNIMLSTEANAGKADKLFVAIVNKELQSDITF